MAAATIFLLVLILNTSSSYFVNAAVDPQKCCLPDQFTVSGESSTGFARGNESFGGLLKFFAASDYTKKGRFFTKTTHTDVDGTEVTVTLITNFDKDEEFFIEGEDCLKTDPSPSARFLKCTPIYMNFAGSTIMGDGRVNITVNTWKGYGNVSSIQFTGIQHLAFTNTCMPISYHMVGNEVVFGPEPFGAAIAYTFFNFTSNPGDMEHFFVPPSMCNAVQESGVNRQEMDNTIKKVSSRDSSSRFKRGLHLSRLHHRNLHSF